MRGKGSELSSEAELMSNETMIVMVLILLIAVGVTTVTAWIVR
jgi:hypothetical protein